MKKWGGFFFFFFSCSMARYISTLETFNRETSWFWTDIRMALEMDGLKLMQYFKSIYLLVQPLFNFLFMFSINYNIHQSSFFFIFFKYVYWKRLLCVGESSRLRLDNRRDTATWATVTAKGRLWTETFTGLREIEEQKVGTAVR